MKFSPVKRKEMKTAEKLVHNIRNELKEIDNQLRNLDFFEKIGNKHDLNTVMKAFLGHQYHIAKSDLRSFAMLIQRFGNYPHTCLFFKNMLDGEISAVDGIINLAQKLKITEEGLINYEVIPEGFAYATYVAWLSTYGSSAEIACGILVNFDAWGYNCSRLSKVLKENFGFTSDDTAFLDAFTPTPLFEKTACEIAASDINNHVSAQSIHRAARLFQGYEKMFWDTISASLK